MTAPLRRRIYLMRHGNVTYFDDTGKPYFPDDVPLNAEGRAQALAAGRVFSQENLHFDRVIVSGLPRTIETAECVLTQTGQQAALEHWADLREIQGGELTALRDDELKNAFLGAFDGIVPEATCFLGGETIGALLDRVHPCLARLRADPDWDTVLLVLHGGVNRAILSYILTGQRLFLGHLGQAAGCINVLDVGVHEADWVARILNYTPLDPLQADSRATMMEVYYEQYRKFRKA